MSNIYYYTLQKWVTNYRDYVNMYHFENFDDSWKKIFYYYSIVQKTNERILIVLGKICRTFIEKWI